jgi:predicted MFS family arabinose efflux permease
MNEARRFVNSTFALFVLTIPIFLSVILFEGNLWILAITLFINGLAIAPLLTAGLALAERSVSPKRTTEVLAWAISALNLGGALPTALTGYIIDTFGPSVAFSIPVICMTLSVLSFLPFLRLWRQKVTQIPVSVP